jgi:hypothetical protein
MLEGALDKVAGYLDKRLVLTTLFPTLVFWSALVWLIGGHIGWHRVLSWWHGLAVEQQVLLAVTFVSAAIFFASMVSIQIGLITRLFEGYWRGPGRLLARPGIRLQRWRHGRLKADNPHDFALRYRSYPRYAEDLLPTRLGNVLKSAELYPGDEGRYGMDAVFFWPRLYMVLPETMRSSLEDARSSLDLMLVASALGGVYALSSICFLALAHITDWRIWLAAVGGGALVALAAYRGAVSSAVTYGELVRTAFDLYRGALLAQLGYAPPASLADEQVLWKNIGQQMYRRLAEDPSVLRYAAASRPARDADGSLAIAGTQPGAPGDPATGQAPTIT